MTLPEYLNKNTNPIFESQGAFNNRTSDFSELINVIPEINVYKDEEYIRLLERFLSDLSDMEDDDFVMIYSNKANYFKIPYDYYDDIKELISDKYKNDFAIKSDDTQGCKIKIGFINKDSKKVSREIFETGRGSKSVTTAQQERATCVIWNTSVNTIKNIDDNKFDLSNEELVKNIISDISEDFDRGWITTFQKQVNLINEYLETIGENGENYLLDRAGDNEVGEAYDEFIKVYAKTLGGRKDNFDPSDAILYKQSDKTKIVDWFKSQKSQIKDLSTAAKSKTDFIKELFDTHLVIGISLKKIMGAKNTGVFETFNIGEEKIPELKKNKYNIKHWNTPAANYIEVECFGNFNFKSTTTTSDEVIGKEKSISLILRSFGSGIVAIDTKVESGPSLGKCPVRLWSDIIGVNDTKDLQDCLSTFRKWLENGKNIEKGLTQIIKGSIKEGGECFPFVLLH